MMPSSLGACQLLGIHEIPEGMHDHKVLMRLSLKHMEHMQAGMLIFFPLKNYFFFY